MKRVLVTGAAGFIGARTAQELLRRGREVVGTDDLNDYYDPLLKCHRLRALREHSRFSFTRGDVTDKKSLERIFKRHRPEAVVHLAAMAGVRASIEDPWRYLSVNGAGVLNALECARRFGAKKVVLASTSSLYAGEKAPFKESAPANTPISPYAASKKTAEMIAYTYHSLYGIHVSVLRYFTVYGPAGRPDMSPFKFIKNILEGRPIVVYGDGLQERDFTYVDDIAEGTVAALGLKGFQTVNLGGSHAHPLREFIRLVEEASGKKARVRYGPWQASDMRDTLADTKLAAKLLRWRPKVGLAEGVRRTVRWHQENQGLVRSIGVRF